jgi:hypothetical protein
MSRPCMSQQRMLQEQTSQLRQAARAQRQSGLARRRKR